ncbi:hypothetical protein SAMN04515668_3361 [Hymenobacter arizonensis]|uniref:Uncharacterized protein n=1 Tax=Hymenobacter arizonensis TaxID=1227077 RepID=A0A1I6A0E6_HYMAR|nr:hypothetical protein SAMN04515668_3361 [Hymenobacter arizonensis]
MGKCNSSLLFLVSVPYHNIRYTPDLGIAPLLAPLRGA